MARDFLYCEETDTKIYPNDVVSISSYPDVKFIAKKGWYTIGSANKNGWYFINISDKSVVPVEQVDITLVSKDIEQGTSEYRPTLKDIDAAPAKSDYIVIPGTNIRLYDSDIVKISNRPRIKWVVHCGWYIYDEVQNFGWYFVSIKDGEILPASIIDLTLVTLVTAKTQGSGIYDGKVVNYTRPFTLADAELLNRTFITLDTVEQRDAIDTTKLINGRMVRVNDVGGVVVYYAWNASTQQWDKIEQSEGQGIPEIVGTFDNPIILAELEYGLYRVKGTYKISENYPTVFMTAIDHLAFVNEGEDVNIKVITEDEITDYIVEGNDVTLVDNYATVQYVEDNYATKVYVDNKIAVLEAEISQIISEFHDKVVEIVYEVLEVALNGIEEQYINNLFN